MPAAPASEYALLTAIILVSAAIPLVLASVMARRRRREGTANGSTMPRRVWWALPVFLVAWWFTSAWLFIGD